MHLLCIFIFILIEKTVGKQVEIPCPEHCKCDLFENLRRATCTNKTIARIESNIPEQTQILDLSYNHILRLGDKVFQDEKLLSLKLLNISHNKIGDIHMNAFQGMTTLKTLDLSYNAIQYIIRNWFFTLSSLEELYLKANTFSILDSGPIFSSNLLTRLDLSNCRVSFIGADALSEIPKLENLDMSDNVLIHFNVAVIEKLENLNVVNINTTSLSCDGQFEELLGYCRKKGIRLIHNCNQKAAKTDKFERMIMADPVDEKNSWIYEDGEPVSMNKTEIETKCNYTHVQQSLLREIVNLSPILSVIIPFVYGIVVGILCAYCLHICTAKRKTDSNENTYYSFEDSDSHLHRRSGRFKRRSLGVGRSYSTEERQNLPLKEWKLSESTPVLYRKNQVHV